MPHLTPYTGCLKNVYVDRRLIDFDSITTGGVVNSGCPQSNGVVYYNEENNGVVSVDGMGYLALVPENELNIEMFQLQFRTLQTDTALVQLATGTTSVNVSIF